MPKFKSALIAVAATGLAVAGYAWIGSQPAAVAQTEGDVVIAEVNGEKIYRSEFEKSFDQLPPQAKQMGMDTIYPLLLERMVDEKLVSMAAQETISPDDPDVEEKMKELRQRVMVQVFVERRIDEEVNDEALRKRYEDWKEANPAEAEVHARHILLETEEKAKEVLDEVEGGKDFAEAAKEHSTGPSGPSGGDLGFFTRDQMVPPFADAAFDMEPGDVSAEPVKTDFGWHIIKVEDRRQKAQPSFDEMREQLTQEATQDIATKLLDDLREDARIVTYDIEGNPMPAEEEAPAAQEETPPAEGGDESGQQ